MKLLFGWILAVLLGLVFWAWVGLKTLWALARRKRR